MSDKEILEKAIQKAIKGGFKWNGSFVDKCHNIISGEPQLTFEDHNVRYTVGMLYFIYNPLFAKALWKSPKKPKYIWQPKESGLWEYDGGYMPDFIGEKWEYHLQQMVISDNPIKYLGENI